MADGCGETRSVRFPGFLEFGIDGTCIGGCGSGRRRGIPRDIKATGPAQYYSNLRVRARVEVYEICVGALAPSDW